MRTPEQELKGLVNKLIAALAQEREDDELLSLWQQIVAVTEQLEPEERSKHVSVLAKMDQAMAHLKEKLGK